MRVWGFGGRPRFLRVLLASGVLASLASATPARAQEDFSGFFLSLDYALTQPGNLDQHFATHVDGSTIPVQTERLVIDNDSATTYRAGIGYRLGKARGSLQVSYWSFENDDTQFGTLNGGVYPTIVGYTYGGGMYIYNPAGVTYAASSSVKAETLDFDYVRPVSMSSKFSMRFLAGMRVAQYQEDQTFSGNDGVSEFFQGKHIESEGGGFRVGAAAVFGMTRHFGLEGGAAISYLLTKTEGLGTSIFPSGMIQLIHGEDDHLRGTIWDFDLKGVWRFRPLDYYIGFSASDWEGLPADPIPAGGCCSGSLAPDSRGRQTVTFTSVHAGFIWRLGGHK